MLINRNQAAKQAGVTRQAIYKKFNEVPRAAFFVELKEGWRVDDDHLEWKRYVRNIELRNAIPKEKKDEFEKLLLAVYETIKEAYKPTDTELRDLLVAIDKRYKDVQ
jgi:hypothetical protein